MSNLTQELWQRLEALKAVGLYRQLRRVDGPQGSRIRVHGSELVNFSSNDYLGLANHPQLKEVAIEAIDKFGAGSGASRLICGSLAPHHELEEALADWKGAEAALSFSSGYSAALGTLCALAGKGDILILDRLVHACLVDAARLSGAKMRVFAHNDLTDLERKLAWAASQRIGTSGAASSGVGGVIVVTESIFSMDGDLAPLRSLVELKEKYGARLLVDEAHATGLYGSTGSGRADAEGVRDRIEVQMGTLGKALGASGGYICGSRTLIDFLVNRARSFIFSTAPVPAAAATATAAIGLVQGRLGAGLRQTLWRHVGQLQNGLAQTAPDLAPRNGMPLSPIVPLMVGMESHALQLAEALLNRGFFVPAIRYPTVGRGRARLRVTLSASHQAQDIVRLLTALGEAHPLGLSRS